MGGPGAEPEQSGPVLELPVLVLVLPTLVALPTRAGSSIHPPPQPR